jgi:gas vesicle protein
MNTRQTQLLTAVAAFAGGFLAGVLLAPQSGREARRRIARTAQDSTRWVEDRLQTVETQLGALEQQIQAAGAQFGEKVQEVAAKTVEQYVPSLPDDSDLLEKEDLTRDLRRMPRT